MKFYTVPLLLAFFPTPTDAILVTIFNVIVSIFPPNWQERLCESMTSQLGSYSTDCPCSIGLSGILDFDVTLGCNDVGSTPCDLSFKGGANLFTGLFSGVDWTGTSACTISAGMGSAIFVTFKLDGSVSLSDPADIDTCTVSLFIPTFPSTVTPGTTACGTNNPFSVSLSCSYWFLPGK